MLLIHRTRLFLILTLHSASGNLLSFLSETTENVNLNILQLVPKHGYAIERHLITTEDGYILETHRISLPSTSPSKAPVLFAHGLVSSSTDWINFGRNLSLAYAFAELGFDVWLANSRGTKFSRRHVRLNPDVDRKQFWAFSFHELGYYDNPAMIDYILQLTQREKLIYIGYSQGCTSFFVMCSERPEYNQKIILAHLMAPAAYWHNLLSPVFRFVLPTIEKQLVVNDLLQVCQNFAYFLKKLQLQQDHIELYEFLPRSVNEMFWPSVCLPSSPFIPICTFIMDIIVGPRNGQIDEKFFPIITSNIPAGGSLRQYLHYAQLVNARTFRKFNYHSEAKNMEMYGQPTPPEYNLSRVTAPVTTHYGLNDWLLNEKDAARTSNALPNLVLNNQIKYARFNHGNFVWAKDIFHMLYNDIINITLQYV